MIAPWRVGKSSWRRSCFVGAGRDAAVARHACLVYSPVNIIPLPRSFVCAFDHEQLHTELSLSFPVLNWPRLFRHYRPPTCSVFSWSQLYSSVHFVALWYCLPTFKSSFSLSWRHALYDFFLHAFSLFLQYVSKVRELYFLNFLQ